MSSSTWQQKFHEEIAGLEDIYRSEQPGISFLAFALREGRFSDGDYLEWASENYSLPWMVSAFFSEREPSAELLIRIKYPWKSELFPIGEWDGHLIVACLEKPEETSLTKNMIFVLTSFEAMVDWWERLQSMAPDAVAGEEVPDGMAGLGAPSMNESAPDGFGDAAAAPLKLDFSSAKPLIVEKPAESDAPASDWSASSEAETPVAEQAASGTAQPAAAAQITSLDSLELALDGFEKTITKIGIAPTDTAKKEEPANKILVNTKPTTKPILEATQITEQKPVELKAAEPKKSILQPKPNTPPKLSKLEPVATKPGAPKPTTPPPSQKPTAPPPFTPPVMSDEEPVTYFMDRTATRQGTPSVEPSSPLPPLSLHVAPAVVGDTCILPQIAAANPEFAGMLENLCGQLKAHYQECVVFAITPDATFLKPFMWSIGIQAPPPDSKIALGSASVFNIAVSTERAYHGYIVPNPINDQAFAILGFPHAPQHATLVPLIFRNQIIGVLMATGEAHCAELPILRWVEKLTKQFMKEMGGEQAALAA